MDAVVDNYFLILEHVGEEIENLEEELIVDPVPETLKAIQNIKGI
jgi:magnesium transporter